MKTGHFLNQALNKLNKAHLECLHELEKYTYYMAQSMGKNFDLKKIVRVTYENPHGISEAVVYPKESVIDGEGVVNPLFFYAYSFEIKEDGIQIWFTEDYKEFQKKY